MVEAERKARPVVRNEDEQERIIYDRLSKDLPYFEGLNRLGGPFPMDDISKIEGPVDNKVLFILEEYKKTLEKKLAKRDPSKGPSGE